MANAFDREIVAAALTEHGSISATARALSVTRERLRDYVNKDPELKALRWEPNRGGTRTIVKPDDVEITGSKPADHEKALREQGLDPDEWHCVLLKSWETYHGDKRWTSVYRRKLALAIVSPARHVPPIIPTRRRKQNVKPDLIVVEGDHQAPFHDEGLDILATEFVRDLQPAEHVFLGDTIDLPTISRHPDHAATMKADVQVCINAGYDLLRRRAEAAPNSRRRKLKGNHDYRIEQELLSRDERMAYIKPAGEDEPALSLRRLLQLDALGIEMVEDIRGWEHAEVELIPGGNGLVVRHGLVTGARTAPRTLAKLGRSAIVGHGHQKESAYRLTYPKKRLQQGFVAGTMCRIDGPGQHFTVNPDWHQGFVTVMRWPDGQFLIEHAVYQNGSLFWRDRRWNVEDYQ